MAAGRYDMEIDQGSEFKLKLVLKNKDGSRKDLTGCTGKAQIRKKPSSITVSGEFDVEFLDPKANGEIVLTLKASTSSAIKVGDTVNDEKSQYVYDFEVYAPTTNIPLRVIDGYIKFSPEVTRN